MTGHTLEIELTATAAAPSLARLSVAEVARVFEFDEETVLELRLAVSEVVTDRLESGEAARILVTVDETSLTVRLPALEEVAAGSIDRRKILAGLERVGVSHSEGATLLIAALPRARNAT